MGMETFKIGAEREALQLAAIVSRTAMKRCELLGLLAVRIQAISRLQPPLAG
jgi:hypothetical protein